MPRRKKLTKPEIAERRRAKSKEQDRAAFRSIQDIGDIPPPVDQRRRDSTSGDFRHFAETYFPQLFPLAWSQDHLKVIAKIETTVLHGGQFAVAMPRGSGKSTLCQVAVAWALSHGHRSFIVLICATDDDAVLALDNVKSHLTENPLLHADFPEVTLPLRELEGVSLRAVGQRYRGERTHVKWGSDRVVLATLPGFKQSGAVAMARGLTGHVRGLQHVRPDGKSIRPDLVIPDDPQTDKSARSHAQVLERLAIVNGALLNLAGPGRKIAAIMPCTVIQRDDVADRSLDQSKHPDWQGERMKMVYSFPTNDELWNEYQAIKSSRERTTFYALHREAMDAGSVVAWPQRHNPDELSAIQHAMNLRFRDEAAFFSEYQNEPLAAHVATESKLSAPQVAERINLLPRGMAPVWAEVLTAFADIHDEIIYYAVMAFAMDFTGAVIDYGTYPDQGVKRFMQSTPRVKLSSKFADAGREGRIRAGLDTVTTRICGSEWKREDGTHLRINQMFSDAGWMTPVVHEQIRRSPYANVLLPSRGIGIGAAGKPMTEYMRKAGERIGLNWYLPKPTAAQGSRQIRFDSNWWKSFVSARLSTPIGDPGAWTLFGKSDNQHDLLCEHLTAEIPIRTEGRGRVVEEWRLPPDRPDNHWFDCVVACAVAANFRAGVTLAQVNRLRAAAPKTTPESAAIAAQRAARRVSYL